MGMIAAALYVPYSRGSVTLRSRDPEVPSAVSQRLLTDPRDAKRMVTATRLAEALINEPSVRDCFEEAYLLPRDPPLRLINGTGAMGAVKAFAAATVLCAPTTLRRAMPSVSGANTNFPTIMIDERVADFIRAARRSG